MGVYDTYGDVQIKIGDVACRTFEIGDKSLLPDGIYIGLEATIVIKGGIFIAEFKNVNDKWGNKLSCDGIITPNHPLKDILKKKKQNWEKEFEDKLYAIVCEHGSVLLGLNKEWMENLIERYLNIKINDKSQKVKIKCKDGCIQIERID